MNKEQFERRLKRERRARAEAEKLLNSKSLELFEAKQTLELALWASREIVWRWDLAENICKVTWFEADIRKKEEHLFSSDLRALVHPDDVDDVFCQIDAHVRGELPIIDLACRYNSQKRWVWLRLRGQATKRNTKGRATHLVGTARDITKQQDQLKNLDKLARFDSLTGVLNRRTMQDALVSLTAGRQKFCLLFIDLDNFKLINDGYGHAVGDEFLSFIAAVLREKLPATALISRFGGDEFLCAFDYQDDWRTVVEEVADIRDLIPDKFSHLTMDTTCSIGVTLFPQHTTDAEKLVEYADTAMYEAKRQGKARYQLYQRAFSLAKKRQFTMLSELRKDVDREQLTFVVQPKYNGQPAIVGAELLCRWESETFGSVSPAVFIPLATEHGLLGRLSQLAVKTAISYHQQLNDAGLSTLLAINVSAEDLLSAKFISELKAQCDEAGVSPKAIELEVTEAIFLNDASKTEAALLNIKEQGFRIAMDDFGTGYSSLSYISRYHFDGLKIDRSFVNGMLSESADRLLVEAIVALCTTLNIRTTAEGVEEQAQLDALKHCGVHEFQGFYLSKPIGFKDFKALLAAELPRVEE